MPMSVATPPRRTIEIACSHVSFSPIAWLINAAARGGPHCLDWLGARGVNVGCPELAGEL